MKKMKIIIWNCLLFAELAGVGPGEEGKSFGSTTEAKLQQKYRDRSKYKEGSRNQKNQFFSG